MQKVHLCIFSPFHRYVYSGFTSVCVLSVDQLATVLSWGQRRERPFLFLLSWSTVSVEKGALSCVCIRIHTHLYLHIDVYKDVKMCF